MTKLCVRGGYEWVEDIAEALDVVERECGYDLREYIERAIDKLELDTEQLRTELLRTELTRAGEKI